MHHRGNVLAVRRTARSRWGDSQDPVTPGKDEGEGKMDDTELQTQKPLIHA